MAYGDTIVLDAIDLDITSGQVVALLGPNGAGKTTTIEILEGFRRRSGGDVRVLGVDPQQATEAWRARVGVVLQSWRDHGPWRVAELLDVIGEYYAAYATDRVSRPWPTGDLMERVGLAEQRGQRIDRLSGGQQARFQILLLELSGATLLLLDEPTDNLDVESAEALEDGLAAFEGTVLAVTHDRWFARSFDRFLVYGADGSVYESPEPVWDEGRVARAR